MAISRKLYNTRKELKLCVECGNLDRPLLNGTLKCDKCRAMTNKSSLKFRHRMKEEGRCQCGREKAPDSKHHCISCVQAIKKWHDKTNAALKIEVFTAYGNLCQCCGESDIAFLHIDHKNGRTSEDDFKGTNLYKYVKKNNYPADFQILCASCNWSKGIFGECPHQINLRNNVLALCVQV